MQNKCTSTCTPLAPHIDFWAVSFHFLYCMETCLRKSCSFSVQDNISIANTTHKGPLMVPPCFPLSARRNSRCVIASTFRQTLNFCLRYSLNSAILRQKYFFYGSFKLGTFDLDILYYLICLIKMI